MNPPENIVAARKYPGRFLRNDRIDELLEKLEIYYQATDPHHGEKTEKNKDLNAALAVALGCRLFEIVSGWAIDHQVGLAIEGRGPFFRGHPEVIMTESYAAEARNSNLHSHEINGRSPKNLTPTQKRQALVNIINLGNGFIPDYMYLNILDDLESLQNGDQSPIFYYRKSSSKLSFRQRQLILKAISFAAYRQARDGLRSMPGIDIVEAYGLIGQKTFTGWLNSSIRVFGEFRVESIIYWARDAGIQSREHLRFIRKNKRDLLEEYNRNEAAYGNDAISNSASEFRSLAQTRRRSGSGHVK